MKSNVKTKILFSVILLLFSFICSAVPIIENGRSDWTIYVPADAIPANKTAAAELQSFLQKATGVKLEITQTAKGENQILIGQSAAAEELLPALKGIKWKSDEIMIAPAGKNLILTGEQPRGPLYAVYEYLERNGFRFWTTKEESIPSLKIIALPEKIYRFAPPIPIRTLNIFEAHQYPFGAKMRLHNPHPPKAVSMKWGGSITLIGPWHTFNNKFMPAAKYLKSNPEFFSLLGGKRVGGQMEGQLCLTNQEMRKVFLENVRAELKQHENPKFISITQNDNDNFCQCDNCKALVKRTGGQSGAVVDFVNFIAESLEKEYPDVIFQTFAYRSTRKPPTKISPRKNVSIFYCTLDHDLTRPLSSGDRASNISIVKDLEGWAKISSMIDIWDYATTFPSPYTPMTNLRVVAEDIKFFHKNKAHLIQIQGAGTLQNNPGEFQALRTYIWAKTLWNPEADTDALIKDFVNGYYGKAAPVILEYLAFRDSIHSEIKGTYGCFTSHAPWIKDKDIMTSLEYIKRAEALAESEVIKNRLEPLRRCMEIMVIFRWETMLEQKLVTKAQLQELSKSWLEYLNRKKNTYGPYWFRRHTPTDTVLHMLKFFSKGIGFERKSNSFLKSLAGKEYVVIEETAFQITNGDLYTSLIQDPKAANGLALSLPPTGHWTAVFQESFYQLKKNRTYQAYVAVKITKPTKGTVLEYCHWRDVVIFQKFIQGSQIFSEYTYIPIGKVTVADKLVVLGNQGYTFLVAKKIKDGGNLIVDHVVMVEAQ